MADYGQLRYTTIPLLVGLYPNKILQQSFDIVYFTTRLRTHTQALALTSFTFPLNDVKAKASTLK